MRRVRYVGIKASRRDNLAWTGLTWTPGQVHEVADEAAAILLRFPSVWMEAVDEPKAQVQAKTPVKRPSH